MAEQLDQAGGASRRALVDLGGASTSLAVPLLKEGAVLGLIMIYRQEVRPFSDKQIALLENFAAQAVIAMENARLITETREALDRQTATAQILKVINRSPGNLAPVFEAMVERAVQLCEADEAAVRSFDGKLLHLVAAHGEPDALEKLRELGPSDLNRPGGLYDPFTRGERVVHIADVRETEAFRNKPIARTNGSKCEIFAPGSRWRCPARARSSASSTSIATRSGRSPKSRLRCWKTSPRRR
jgi:hypothetical protein